LNTLPIVGDPARLDVDIATKTFVGARGAAVEVVCGFSLRLAAGRFGALIGPSGCGKTTILRIVAGLERDFSGTVRLPGAGRLGMVFQEPRLLPWRTVEDNVRLALAAAGMANGDSLDALFATLGLAEHRGHYPGELSLGLARRVAVARAFAIRPDLLLLDEPFVSLDEATAHRLRDELRALRAARPATTLMVTHDVEEAIGLADTLFLLSEGPARVLRAVPVPLAPEERTPAAVARIRAGLRDLLAAASP
jgi:ABC-type nitrate/sulfonate/bicarbonate transport system ATPase subunit